MIGFFAEFVFEEENPSSLVLWVYRLTQFHVEFPVMFYDGTNILFHAFTRMGIAVSWVKGDSGQKTKEARSLVSIISKPFKFLPLLILLTLGEIIVWFQFELQAVYHFLIILRTSPTRCKEPVTNT